MQYGTIVFGTFIERPNRFIARVRIDGQAPDAQPVTVHVKNTGRCRELLVPGCRVVLERAANPARKTPFDLIATYKQAPRPADARPASGPQDDSGNEGWLFNIDSQAPNKVVGEWLDGQGFSLVRPEFTYGASRVDFYMERGGQRFLMEVKGCTLEHEGIGYFPDAPTERGIKHLRELAGAVDAGYQCYLAFVIQMEGVSEVRPNVDTHPEFGQALAEAQAAGVQVLFLQCAVTPGTLAITTPPLF